MLKVKKLSFSYGNLKVLNDLSFEVSSSKITGIIGPNGAGKSTLLRSLVGLETASFDTVLFKGQPLLKTLSLVAYVPQSSNYDWTFPLSVSQLVELSFLTKTNFWRFNKKAYQDNLLNIMSDLQIDDLASRHISELSGGQKQRVLIARALCQPFDLLILDEPFTGVDYQSEQIIINVIKRLKSLGKTILMVHHNLNTVKEYFDNLILLNKNIIASGPVESVFTKENLKQAYQGEILLDL